MGFPFYNPFEDYDFNAETCFLSGEKLESTGQQITVFPEWILNRYQLGQKKFTLMDQITSYNYADLKIPCSQEVINTALSPLEEIIQSAFESGYAEVKNVSELSLFQWMGKIIYGVLYHDLLAERKRAARRNIVFKISPLLIRRFSLLHLMLQSLIAPVEFSSKKPWSICVFKSKISKDVFNYKDEPTNLNFSITMNDFGIVACLQDNGAVATLQQQIIDKFSGKVLHPIQLEEIFARFIYSNYLLKKSPEYKFHEADGKLIIESLPYLEEPNDIFAKWDDELFAQVLSDYWKPWGLTKKQIYQFPNSPLSFLINEFDNKIIEPEAVALPF